MVQHSTGPKQRNLSSRGYFCNGKGYVERLCGTSANLKKTYNEKYPHIWVKEGNKYGQLGLQISVMLIFSQAKVTITSKLPAINQLQNQHLKIMCCQVECTKT